MVQGQGLGFGGLLNPYGSATRAAGCRAGGLGLFSELKGLKDWSLRALKIGSRVFGGFFPAQLSRNCKGMVLRMMPAETLKP